MLENLMYSKWWYAENKTPNLPIQLPPVFEITASILLSLQTIDHLSVERGISWSSGNLCPPHIQSSNPFSCNLYSLCCPLHTFLLWGMKQRSHSPPFTFSFVQFNSLMPRYLLSVVPKLTALPQHIGKIPLPSSRLNPYFYCLNVL